MTAPTHMPDTGQVVVATRKAGSGLTGEEHKFLSRIVKAGGFATRREVGCVISREQDRARQSCRRRGYVEHQGTAHGRKKSGWALSNAGRAALAASEAHDAGGNDG